MVTRLHHHPRTAMLPTSLHWWRRPVSARLASYCTMSSSSAHVFSARAALFPLLHAARYPSSVIIGCLLGAPSAPSESVTYAHAIPLLHHWTGLSFAFELALQFIQEYAEAKGWIVLGLYFANEGLEDTTSVPQLVQRVVKAAKEVQGQEGRPLSVFALDNNNLTTDSAFVAVDPSTSLRVANASVSFSDPKGSPSQLPRLLKAKQHLRLEDFDQHLEDIGARWLSNDGVDLDAEPETDAKAQ